MIDLSIFEKYHTNLDKDDLNIIHNDVINKSPEEFIEKQFIYLDCSRIYKDGSRAMQTIGYPYKRELMRILYVISNYEFTEEERDNYCLRLIELHNKNIEYEKLNPPIEYASKTKKVTKKQNAKQPSLFPETQTANKETAVRRKLKAKTIKLNALKFNIKPT